VDSGTEIPVSITNISHGGISIECSRQLDEGGAARLKFVLPGAKRAMEVKGEVMWSNPEGQAGIRFQVITVDVKQELDKWLERHSLPLNNGAIFINAML
jgi:Tfp pilus assembly protein PilZ